MADISSNDPRGLETPMLLDDASGCNMVLVDHSEYIHSAAGTDRYCRGSRADGLHQAKHTGPGQARKDEACDNTQEQFSVSKERIMSL